jgi:hypothetical protein
MGVGKGNRDRLVEDADLDSDCAESYHYEYACILEMR